MRLLEEFMEDEQSNENSFKVPDVVYHGTDAKFDKFKQMGGTVSTDISTDEVKRTGFFFTPDKVMAKEFGKNVASVKLHVSRVADMTADGMDNTIAKKWEDAGHEWDGWADVWEMFDGDEGEEFVAFLQKKGYDGVAFTEPAAGEGKAGLAYVVFDPEDIEILEWN